MQAAKSGMTEVCKLYIEHGAEVDACTVVGGCRFWRMGGWVAIGRGVGIEGGGRQSLQQRFTDTMIKQ